MFRKYQVLASILVMLIFPAAVNSADNKDDFVRAEIYYFEWDIETLVGLTPESVRSQPTIKTIIQSPIAPLAKAEVAALRRWLRIEEMKPTHANKKSNAEDARLVIDFYRSDGSRVTYYASRFNLISEDHKIKRPIDDAFREKFRFHLLRRE